MNLRSRDISQRRNEIDNDDENDLIAPNPLPPWDDGRPFESSMNCPGVVHVRLISAQRLPCPVGSSVCALVSLPPWQGRVRTERVSAFLPSSSSIDHGVSVTWDQVSDQGVSSMVNAWSDDDSQVPSIRVDLMFSPLGLGIFEFAMCYLEIDCTVLMKSHNVWKRQWFQAEMKSSTRSSEKSSKLRSVLINLEAMFAPGPDRPDQSPPLDKTELSHSNQVEVVSESEQQEEYSVEIPEETIVQVPDNCSDKNMDVKLESDEKSQLSLPTNSDEKSQVTIPQLLSDKYNPHLLRLVSFWVPTSCAVCSTVLLGKSKGFRCEECEIVCCSDCRLHVDLKIPCGSDAARMAVRGKMSVNNLLSIVAPDETFHQSRELQAETRSIVSEKEGIGIDGGIGRLKFTFTKAVLFKQSLPSDTDPEVACKRKGGSDRVRVGDYYARVSISGTTNSGRTPTIQNTGMPKFGSVEMNFLVQDYGREFRLDIIDASSDTIVGTTLLTTQGLLQGQRDAVIRKEGFSLFQSFKGPLLFKGNRTLRQALRVPNPHGFFVAPKAKAENQQESSGGIVGWVQISASFMENTKKLYTTDYECPPRPPLPFNVSNFQAQLRRIKSLVDDLMSLVEDINYLFSWENPILTIFSMFLFVAGCLSFDSEYCLSLPLLFLLLWMLRFSFIRRDGARKTKFIRQEVEKLRKTEKLSLTYLLHRSIGTVEISMTRGSKLLSRDGMPGKVFCNIIFDPLKYVNEKAKKKMSKFDKASQSTHAIGFTNSRYAADPEWELQESVENKRMKQLLPLTDKDETSENSTCTELSFPILQPFSLKSNRKDTEGRYLDAILSKWEDSPAALVFQVKFSDLLFGLGFEYILGEVVIPFADLVEKGKISGWFEVTSKDGPSSFVASTHGKNEVKNNDLESSEKNSMRPSLFVSLKWNPPATGSDHMPDETDRELAFVIQEELVRSSAMKKQEFDLVGTSLGAVNTALGIGGNLQDVQNTMSSALDLVESILNLFNFTDPFKSSILFLFLVVIWAFFNLVPSRYIILSVGLSKFFFAFNVKFGIAEKLLINASKNVHVDSLPDGIDEDEKEGTLALWAMNALRSLPTSEDLRKLYFWESLRIGYNEIEKHAQQKRGSRLKRLWKAHWYSRIRLWVRGPNEKEVSWQTVFAVLQGHRFLWWQSVRDFDDGENPAGVLCLTGHAGLSNPSPIEAREFSREELRRLVVVFGRGPNAQQQRITLLPQDLILKKNLENMILDLAAKDD